MEKSVLLFLFIWTCFSTAFIEAHFPHLKNSNIFSKKMSFLNEIVDKAVICYRRYQECSVRFSEAFCISPLQHFSFYIWARRMANDILDGKYDENKHVTCSKRLVRNIVNGQLSSLVKHAMAN